MASFVKFQDFVEQLGKGVHNFSSNTLKIALSNTAPTVASDDTLSDITQISATGGYTAGAGGGYTLSGVTWGETAGTASLSATDLVITASGGSVGPLRYVILYNDTPTSPVDPLIAYWDYGSSITLATGETLTVDFAATILTLA